MDPHPAISSKLPVLMFGSGLILHSRDGRVRKANGHVYSGSQWNGVPDITPDQAMSLARDLVRGNYPQVDEPKLIMFPGVMMTTFPRPWPIRFIVLQNV